MTRLKICATEVPPDGQGTLKDNPNRIAAAERLIRAVHWPDVELYTFPAGFLRAENEAALLDTAAPMLDVARRTGKAVLFGVDTEPLRKLPSRRVEEGTLPSFLFGSTPDARPPVLWHQRSRTRHDAALARDTAPRFFPLPSGFVIAPLIGGEIFSPAIRHGLAADGPPDLVILCAHSSLSARHWEAQQELANQGLLSVRTVHHPRPAVQALMGPLGYRLPNLSMGAGGLHASVYSIGADDRSRDAA